VNLCEQLEFLDPKRRTHMPGWWIHTAVARKAITELVNNTALFPAGTGPDAQAIYDIANNHPAYAAVGAIGPDLFFLLPDFAPSGISIFGNDASSLLFGAAHAIITAYDLIDPVVANYADQIAPIEQNAADILNAATGGLAQSISQAASLAASVIIDQIEMIAASQYDIWGILGSGVPRGYDEQVFYWSDILHYRKTYEYARRLWTKADQLNNDRFKAYAIGWMTHCAADVTGHALVNEKCGGPYRLHWQRHHCCENHFDGKVYEAQYGAGIRYQDVARSAMHLWLAFNPSRANGSAKNFLDANDDRPHYQLGDDAAAYVDRRTLWDVDSDMPDDLAQFIVDALVDVYSSTDPNFGQWANHPTILNALNVGNSTGFPVKDDVKACYWWLYKYVKITTTDYYRFQPPEPPTVFSFAPWPSQPNPPASLSPAGGPLNTLQDLLDLFFQIHLWLTFCEQVIEWFFANQLNLFTGPATYYLREAIYEFVQIPLYNLEMSFHYYLSLIGFVHPFNQEIAPALTTLGVGFTDAWNEVEAALASLTGGLGAPPTGTELSGSDRSNPPVDAVTDPASAVSLSLQILDILLGPPCHESDRVSETPSEFTRPYLYPERDQQQDLIGRETPLVVASPYVAGQDANVLMGNTPGDPAVRSALESATSEAATQSIVAANMGPNLSFANKQHLGDPAEYSAYVISQLTRDNPGPIANFNLDADRGYGYLCWDWVRSHYYNAHPKHNDGTAVFTGTDQRTYMAPLVAGFGWCAEDLEAVSVPQPPVPHMHYPQSTNPPVKIRYIDKEQK
jgi:hypothetical protein